MADNERPLVDRVWEFTKDLSVKVSRKAEKHWKINTLRVEIASIKHRINVKYKELGRYVYESLKSSTVQEESYKASVSEFYDELSRLENEIVERENRIEILEQEMSEAAAPPPVPPAGGAEAVVPDVPEPVEKVEKPEAESKPTVEAASKADSEETSEEKPSSEGADK